MQEPIISVMLAVEDTPAAVEWYQRALGAKVLWSLGSVAGLEIAGAPFFLGEPANNGWESPVKLGITSTRVEVFCDDPGWIYFTRRGSRRKKSGPNPRPSGALGRSSAGRVHRSVWAYLAGWGPVTP